MDDWGWIVAGVAGLIVVYAWTRAADKRKKRAQAEKVLKAIMEMMHAFEEIVKETIGSRFSTEDRRKIAAGMVVVVIAERIPIERLAADRELFAAVLLKSIQLTTQ